ncbi:hypothetical protein COCON_G00153330 [Conger conger]|uniref:Uncharacterized protein n=1 Tax=Conger conger TaxID=82655 RepID=A0A9Q1D8P2_CONCO|nr:hypothetical protein COCON_G00153330 [Conger conger]
MAASIGDLRHLNQVECGQQAVRRHSRLPGQQSGRGPNRACHDAVKDPGPGPARHTAVLNQQLKLRRVKLRRRRLKLRRVKERKRRVKLRRRRVKLRREEGEAEEVEGEAEETAAEEVQSGVQEAPENSQSEPGSQSSPLAGTEVLQTEVMLPAPPHTAGQEKVSSRKRRNAKPGDPANTQRTPPPFIYIVLLFLFFVSTVNSNPIHAMQGALCRDPESAKNVSRIYKGDKLIWSNSYGRIKNCSKDNLKPDEPCWLPNGSLVVQSDQPLSFEGNDSLSGGMKAFPSETVFCADLDLPPGPKSLPAPLVNTTANTTSPDTGPPSALQGVIYAQRCPICGEQGGAQLSPKPHGGEQAFTHCTQYQASFRSTSTPAKPTTHPRGYGFFLLTCPTPSHDYLPWGVQTSYSHDYLPWGVQTSYSLDYLPWGVQTSYSLDYLPWGVPRLPALGCSPIHDYSPGGDLLLPRLVSQAHRTLPPHDHLPGRFHAQDGHAHLHQAIGEETGAATCLGPDRTSV